MPGDEPERAAPRRILIVEDNALNLKLVKDILDFHGYATVATGSGAEALDLARHHQPHLILLDIQLPGMSGIEAVRRLKTDEQTRAIPVVAVTAFAMPGDQARILDSGCDGYLAKPFNVRALLAVVASYIGASGSAAAD
jgi:two-component system, cell cycle response regulator DivK